MRLRRHATPTTTVAPLDGHAPWCTNHTDGDGLFSCCGSVKVRVPAQSLSIDDWLEPGFVTSSLTQEENRPVRIRLDLTTGNELNLADAETLATQLLKLVEVARRG